MPCGPQLSNECSFGEMIKVLQEWVIVNYAHYSAWRYHLMRYNLHMISVDCMLDGCTDFKKSASWTTLRSGQQREFLRDCQERGEALARWADQYLWHDTFGNNSIQAILGGEDPVAGDVSAPESEPTFPSPQNEGQHTCTDDNPSSDIFTAEGEYDELPYNF